MRAVRDWLTFGLTFGLTFYCRMLFLPITHDDEIENGQLGKLPLRSVRSQWQITRYAYLPPSASTRLAGEFHAANQSLMRRFVL
jgi:hypothetical protein